MPCLQKYRAHGKKSREIIHAILIVSCQIIRRGANKERKLGSTRLGGRQTDGRMMKRKGNCAVKEEKIGPTVPPKLRSKTIVPLGLHLTSSAIRAPGCVRSEAQIAERHSPAQGIFLWAFPSQLYLWRGRLERPSTFSDHMHRFHLPSSLERGEISAER